ncbi:MAG: nitrogenase molybdenum-iron protein subunit beta [Alphaproteobacteria bacterium]|nr:nitrogenase molybdenum-iron protein subunit beta [Alphaproteobacteria bacterium]
MPQNALKIKDHIDLFNDPEYLEIFKRKRAEFEDMPSDDEVAKQAAYINSVEYREKNLAREALVINPAKACQPVGAAYCSAGFEGTLAFTHGSLGCAAYFRSHLSRHFKEPSAMVCSAMTEDAAVFGGLNNMIEGLANAYALYKPKMIAVHTSCMAEVIGDDLNSFIIQSREKGSIPEDFPVAFAHTPSFVGSHVVGYDNMMKSILSNFWEGKERKPGKGVNIIGGFDGYGVANAREIKDIIATMGIEGTLLSDVSDVYDTPADGSYRMYDGGTSLADTAKSLDAKATLSLQEWCSDKTLDYAKSKGQEVATFNYPIGLSGTDEFLMKLSQLTGKPIPESIARDRGRLVDAIEDSLAWIHGKSFSIFGDPDFVLGMTRFVMELGGEPLHLLCTNGNADWETKMKELLASSPFGAMGQVWKGKDLWHMRSLLATEPSDYLIGSSYGKYLEKDTGVPLIRIGFPIFDRHHHHRFPTLFYKGGLRVLVTILDKIFDTIDEKTKVSGISYDLTR